MKYYNIIILFLVPTIGFANSVGQTSFGLDIGWLSGKRSNEIEGAHTNIGLNFNTFSKDNYGLDLGFDFSWSSQLEHTSVETEAEWEYYHFDCLLRPYMEFYQHKIFVELAASRLVFQERGEEALIKDRSFVPSVGSQLSFDKLIFTPTIDFIDFGPDAKGIIYHLPLSYSIIEGVDIKVKFSNSSLDYGSMRTWLMGIDLKFAK
jgi:hypothetical protein